MAKTTDILTEATALLADAECPPAEQLLRMIENLSRALRETREYEASVRLDLEQAAGVLRDQIARYAAQVSAIREAALWDVPTNSRLRIKP